MRVCNLDTCSVGVATQNPKLRKCFTGKPEEEELIGKYFKEEYQSDFVFVTHYPSKKRPFYAIDDPRDMSRLEP
jgi:Glutamate synthase domain 2